MSIETKESRFGSKFEISHTAITNRSILASGSPSGESVRVEIDEPASGYGTAERPGTRTEIVMSTLDFVEWTTRVLEAIQVKSGDEFSKRVVLLLEKLEQGGEWHGEPCCPVCEARFSHGEKHGGPVECGTGKFTEPKDCELSDVLTLARKL